MDIDAPLIFQAVAALVTTLGSSLPALVFYIYITVKDQKFRVVTMLSIGLVIFSAITNAATTFVTYKLYSTMTMPQINLIVFAIRGVSTGIWIVGNSIMYILFAMQLFPKKGDVPVK